MLIDETRRRQIIRETVKEAIADFRKSLDKLMQPMPKKRRRKGKSEQP